MQIKSNNVQSATPQHELVLENTIHILRVPIIVFNDLFMSILATH